MDIETVAAAAASAAGPCAAVSPPERATALVAVAAALESAASRLIPIAIAETGLSKDRLEVEMRRTCGQLRLFAEVVVDGAHLDARLDAADGAYVIGARPDVRRVLVPVGPVLNFAASNFPFAFSVAGGDSASALAAGCPVIVKAHPGHPELSRATAELVARALVAADMPDGTFQLAEGEEAGIGLLTDDRIRAATFTGSLRAGRMLAEIAAARPRPIPFFGELGSVNPVYITPSAARAETDLAAGFVDSVSSSAGQLCTKPGFLFMPRGAELDEIGEHARRVTEHRMLNGHVGAGYMARRSTVLATPGVTVLAQGSSRQDADGEWYATPTIVAVDAETLRKHRRELLDECFGPLAVVVRYDALTELAGLQRELFPGNLAGTVHATRGESGEIQPLIAALADTCGRVLFGGWPTGVSVTSAMQHGGPFPAATIDATSVGTAAITRFLRGVAYQNAPQELLPPPLRDDNPWGVPQRRGPVGTSSRWGTLTGSI